VGTNCVFYGIVPCVASTSALYNLASSGRGCKRLQIFKVVAVKTFTNLY